ncbi:glycosyltransferase [Planomonospora corallina]|uniref:Glycosyltransferase n=1 Tax=Planomonospora corallina TaxID=1806052 RepID=A0ABV8I4U4_9ACTN
MRVLHVITALTACGAGQQLRALLPHLDAECEVAVLTGPTGPVDPTGPTAAAAEAGGEGTPVAEGGAEGGAGAAGGSVEEAVAAAVPVHHVGMRGHRDLRAVRRLARLMRAGRYDVVHTHLYRACVYGRVAAHLVGVPVIVATEHSLGEERIDGRRTTPGTRALYRVAEALGDVTVAVSVAVADRLARWGVPRSRIEVIPNGIDPLLYRHDPRLRHETRARLGIPQDVHVVGGVGRLEPGKRFDVLLEAVAGLDETVLLLAGEGGARWALAERAQALGIKRRVVFAGASADVPALLSAVDVLASPSVEETFGLAAVEGLAAGLPVLYSCCPALEELPAHAAPGALRVPSDAGRLRAELRALAAAGPLRLQPPPAVAHYDIRRHAARTGTLYERLLREASPAAIPAPVPAPALAVLAEPPEPPGARGTAGTVDTVEAMETGKAAEAMEAAESTGRAQA